MRGKICFQKVELFCSNLLIKGRTNKFVTDELIEVFLDKGLVILFDDAIHIRLCELRVI